MKWPVTILAVGALSFAIGVANAADVEPDKIMFEEGAVSTSLTGVSGDATVGVATFASRKLGNCLACHAVASLSKELFHGDVGPELNGVADRWNEAELRAIVSDSKKVFGDETVMPGFYSLNAGANVGKEFVGKTILGAQDVEDVVAFLMTLKE